MPAAYVADTNIWAKAKSLKRHSDGVYFDTECLDVTPQTKGLQAFPQLFPSEMESTLKLFKNKQPTVNPFISLDKTNDPHSFTTPQKRQFKDEQAQQATETCHRNGNTRFGSTDNVYTVSESIYMDTGHCKYLDNAFNKIGRYFKAAIQDSFADDDNDEPF
ncbi:hypothetical protein RhiirA4_543355, partial [Rhizophagus irregularis]